MQSLPLACRVRLESCRPNAVPVRQTVRAGAGRPGVVQSSQRVTVPSRHPLSWLLVDLAGCRWAPHPDGRTAEPEARGIRRLPRPSQHGTRCCREDSCHAVEVGHGFYMFCEWRRLLTVKYRDDVISVPFLNPYRHPSEDSI